MRRCKSKEAVSDPLPEAKITGAATTQASTPGTVAMAKATTVKPDRTKRTADVVIEHHQPAVADPTAVELAVEPAAVVLKSTAVPQAVLQSAMTKTATTIEPVEIPEAGMNAVAVGVTAAVTPMPPELVAFSRIESAGAGAPQCPQIPVPGLPQCPQSPAPDVPQPVVYPHKLPRGRSWLKPSVHQFNLVEPEMQELLRKLWALYQFALAAGIVADFPPDMDFKDMERLIFRVQEELRNMPRHPAPPVPVADGGNRQASARPAQWSVGPPHPDGMLIEAAVSWLGMPEIDPQRYGQDGQVSQHVRNCMTGQWMLYRIAVRMGCVINQPTAPTWDEINAIVEAWRAQPPPPPDPRVDVGAGRYIPTPATKTRSLWSREHRAAWIAASRFTPEQGASGDNRLAEMLAGLALRRQSSGARLRE